MTEETMDAEVRAFNERLQIAADALRIDIPDMTGHSMHSYRMRAAHRVLAALAAADERERPAVPDFPDETWPEGSGPAGY